MPLYRYVGNANSSDGTNELVTKDGRIKLGGAALAMSEENFLAIPKRYILEKVGETAPGPVREDVVTDVPVIDPEPAPVPDEAPSTPSALGNTSTAPILGK